MSSELIDATERDAALQPDRSFLVQAPAGSGKTGLLVQRILRLLSVVERPESIVAVTFTIKAAAEMRERVLEALREAASPEDQVESLTDFDAKTRERALSALQRDREMGWNLLTDSSQLQIQTIDALCATLVRKMPLVAEAGGTAQVIEDAGMLYREAARRVLQQLGEGGVEERGLFSRVSLHFDNDIARLESQIAVMLNKRDQWHDGPAKSVDRQIAEDFCLLLALAERELVQVFRHHQCVDFTAITRSAIAALGGDESPTDLLYTLDYRIEHLLVDEFQDTSRAQYQLLEKLTGQWSDGDGRTLFLVGDPLQSIYGFRAAEVGLFLRCVAARRLGAVRLEILQLRANFRSTPQLVQWVGTALQPALNTSDEAAGAVALVPSEAARTDAGVPPEVIPFLDDQSGQEEASRVVTILREEQDRSGVAILVRSRSHAVAILRALRRAEIRYQAVDMDPLGSQQHILDLISLTRAVMHLADRTAWLACLRAPFCGLTLHDLAGLTNDARDITVLDLLSDPERIRAVAPDNRFRAVRAQEILLRAVKRIGRSQLRQVVESAWLELGGPAILRQQNQLTDVGTFLTLLEELEEGGIIRDFGRLSERLKTLYAEPDTADECLRVMTIHEAKGLEFDSVILPHLASPPPGDDEELLVWNQTIDGDVELAAQPRRGEDDLRYKAIQEALKQKRRNEGKRLFYVACTRAKNRLYLLGSVKRNKAGDDVCKAQSHTFLGMIWDQYKPAFQALLKKKPATQSSLFEVIPEPRSISRLPPDWRIPHFQRSLAWQPQFETRRASDREISYRWVSKASRHVGTVVHGLLNQFQHLRDLDQSAIRSSIRQELARLGVNPRELETAADQAWRAFHTTTASDRGRWIFGDHRSVRSEYAISGLVEDRLITGVIDRCFVDRQDRFWIIDFKTSTHEGGNRGAFLRHEQQRYREQMEAYAALITLQKKRDVMLGLYFPLLDEWIEWIYTPEETAAAVSLN